MSEPLAPGPGWKSSSAAPLMVCVVAYSLALGAGWIALVLYDHPSALIAALSGDIAATLVIFCIGWAISNSSVYDPYWSLAPPILMLFWMLHPEGNSGIVAREVLLFGLLVCYAGRLTFNCFRRWQDMHHEDFRYRNFRVQFGAFYPVIDLFGIQLFPTLLVFAGCLSVFAVTQGSTALNWIDLVALIVTLGAISIEAIADKQLEAFKNSDHEPGSMCTTGLWGWSQHPNYFGELGFWWGLWLFALAVDPSWWWTVVGPIAMTVLFVAASIPMIVKQKRLSRPNYDEMVKGISLLIPWPPKRPKA